MISEARRSPSFATIAIAAAMAWMTASCSTVGPDYHTPEQAAINRSAAAEPFSSANEAPFSPAALPPQWWRLYHDATLDALIDKAFTANTDLRVASANLARAHAVLDEAEEARRPSVKADAAPGYGRPSAIAKGFPEAFNNAGNYDAGVSVSYQVDLFGKISRALEAADADIQAMQAAYDLARITVAADTTRAYVNACAAGQQILVAKRSIDLQQQFVQLTEQRITAGRGTAFDSSRARSQLEQLRGNLPPLQAQQRTALYRLAILTGEVPTAFPAGVTQCNQVPRITTTIPVGDGAALLRRRPDIRQAERSLASATARIGIATADLYPSISLGLSVGSTGLLEKFGASNAFRWNVGPLISWSLPATSSAHSRIAQAEAGSAAALARFDATVLNALRETETALTGYARELDRHAALKAAREESALAAEQAHTLFRYGRTDFLTTLDTQRTLANAESTLSMSEGQLANDQVALFLALGGGWEEKKASK